MKFMVHQGKINHYKVPKLRKIENFNYYYMYSCLYEKLRFY